MEKPTSGNTDVPAKSAASKTKRKTTNVKNSIIIKKLILFNKNLTMMENNNESGEETVNLSNLDVLDQTTIEIELSGNEPSVQNDSNFDPNVETNEEQLRYVFETVEGERYIFQGTSDRRVEIITLDQGGNQTAQENSESENGNEVIEVLETADVINVPTMADGGEGGNVPTVDISSERIIVPTVADGGEGATTAESEFQNILATGRDLLNLMESATAERGERINENDNENGNQNPDPVEVLEIPEEENSEEEHDTELENANQQAWENQSAAQKRYLEVLEAGRTRRKLIIRCMRNPGEVRFDPNVTLHPFQDRWNRQHPELTEEEELAQECELDNAVVELNRNDIPN